LELCKFDSPEGQHAFWHSSAHILGQALERRYQGYLCIGPPVEKPGGFYYDMAMADDGTIQEEHFPEIEQLVSFIVKEKQPFERLELTKEQALEMFSYNRFKSEIIQTKVPDGESCTAYRCGPLIDLCRGPHIPHTGRVKAFSITNVCAILCNQPTRCAVLLSYLTCL
jgi:threonyl-tRNA synthetase